MREVVHRIPGIEMLPAEEKITARAEFMLLVTEGYSSFSACRLLDSVANLGVVVVVSCTDCNFENSNMLAGLLPQSASSKSGQADCQEMWATLCFLTLFAVLCDRVVFLIFFVVSLFCPSLVKAGVIDGVHPRRNGPISSF